MFLMPFGCRRTAAEEGCGLTGSHSCRRLWKAGWCTLFAPSGLIRGEKRVTHARNRRIMRTKSTKATNWSNTSNTHKWFDRSLLPSGCNSPSVCFFRGRERERGCCWRHHPVQQLVIYSSALENSLKKKLPTLHQLSHSLFLHREIKRFQLSMNSSRACQPIWGLTAAAVDRLLRTNEQTLQMVTALFSETRDCLKW